MNGDLRTPARAGRMAGAVMRYGRWLVSLGVLVNGLLGIAANCTFGVRYSCSRWVPFTAPDPLACAGQPEWIGRLWGGLRMLQPLHRAVWRCEAR